MKENQIFSKRLISLRLNAGLTQADLAKDLGVVVGSVGNWESSDVPPGPKNLKKIADYFGVSIAFLLGEIENESGRVTALRDEARQIYRTVEGLPMANGQAAPLISWASAGNAAAYEDQGFTGERIPTGCRDPHCYCLQVEGDSMEEKYSRGDVIFVAPTQQARNGDLVVAKTRTDDVYFKIYHWSGQEKDTVKLSSYNKAYPVIEMPREEFHFIQPVHSVLRRLRRDI